MPPKVNSLRTTLFALVVFAPPGAQADVTVQERGTLSVSNIDVRTASTRQIAGEKERTETEVSCQGTATGLCGQNQQTDIIRLDREVIWELEPGRRRYIETSFPTAALRPAAQRSCPQPQPTAAVLSQCELTDPVASMQMTGDVATFAGAEGKRTIFRLIQSCRYADPTRACTVVYSFEVWLAPEDTAGLRERRAFQHRYLTLLGADRDAGASPPEYNEYLAPYRAVMQRLAENSEQLEGFPLKTTFRLTFSGQPCGSMHPPSSSPERPSVIAGASDAAARATSNSAQHSVGWGTEDALRRSTGSGAAGYVAGSAAGAFTGSLVSGLFAKKSKPQPPPLSNLTASTTEAAATLLEFNLETTSLSASPVPAAQFETPPRWSKVSDDASVGARWQSCPAGALKGASK